MNRITSFFLFGAFLVTCHSVMAYKEDTHDKISEAAANISILKTDDNVLHGIGLRLSIDDDRQQFPNSKGESRNILNLVRDGAKFEDAFPRSLNHFFDPLNDKGLLGVNIKSPDWALEDKAEIESQVFSYKRARGYFYDALTMDTKTKRDRNFGLTFQTLGQVIHHLQDMAQPQHVRDDDHCDAWPCKLVPGLYNPSAYEKYTDQQREKGNLFFDTYAPVNSKDDLSFLSTARSFWHTQTQNPQEGKGIAEFTNTNFVSAGTNFNTNTYLSPRRADATPHDEDANALFQSANIPIPAECLPPNAPCVMTFYSSQVEDNYRFTERST